MQQHVLNGKILCFTHCLMNLKGFLCTEVKQEVKKNRFPMVIVVLASICDAV